MKLNKIVRTPGITTPASSKISAGPKKIVKAIGRAFLPFARPAIVKITPRTIKKIAIAENAEVNLGTLTDKKFDISNSPFFIVYDLYF
jgi:hypothetical protein